MFNKNIFLKSMVLAFVIFFSVYTSAVTVDFPNGGFETGDLTDWNAMDILSPTGFLGWAKAPANHILIIKNESFNLESNTNICFSYITHNNGTTGIITVYATNDYNGILLKSISYDTADNEISKKICVETGTLPTNEDANSYVDGLSMRKLVIASSHNQSRAVPMVNLITDSVYTNLIFTDSDGIYDVNFSHETNHILAHVDNIYVGGHTLTVTEPVEPISPDTSFEIRATVTDSNGSNIVNADVNITLNGDTNNMVYSNGAYRITFPNGLPTGLYSFDVNSNWDSITNGSTGQLLFTTKEFQYLTITPIENISSWSYGSVDFIPTDELKQIIWRVDSNSTNVETPTYKIFNSLIDGRQYFIYTSSDGISWALNDTLTFGSTNYDPIQKIWDDANNIYEHSFEDTLSPLETKYYKLTYRNPYKTWQTISESNEWFTGLAPNSVIDVNSITYDEYSISIFSNIRNIYIPEIPFISGDETVAYELQFTAWSDTNGTTIKAGTQLFTHWETTDVNLTSEPHRYSFPIQNISDPANTQALMISSAVTGVNIYITDYALVPRGFWTKSLDLRKINGDVFDSILIGGYSKQYVQEGRPFRISTEAYDIEGKIKILRVEAYLDNYDTSTRVKRETSNPYGDENATAESILTFDDQIDPIIDLFGNAITPINHRTVFITASLVDDDGKTVSVQSGSFKFIQYPYFPNDLKINFYPTEKRLGKNPAGLLSVFISEPSRLEGFDFRIYSDTNSFESPNFRKTLYNGQDFNCSGVNCSFNVKFNEFLLEDVNLTTISVQALLNTEYQDPDNLITRTIRNFYVTPIIFDIAKIYQVGERIDRTYVNYEEIPLVLILRDQEVTDISNKVEVYLNLENCDASSGGNCATQTDQYKPSGHFYDSQLGVNFYFFQNLFLLDDGELLPDGNYIGFHVTTTDKTGVRASEIAVLTDKCQNQNYLPEFLDNLANPIGMASFLYNSATEILAESVSGCQPGSEQYDKVTTVENTAQEQRLLIDNTKVRTSPDQEIFQCVAPDTNNIIPKPLEQDFLCYSLYSIGEKPIDDFRVRISNNYSDFTEEGSTKQYKEFNIPFEITAQNDPQLLKNQLEVNYQTEINTVGEFLYYGLIGLAKNFVIGSGLQDEYNFKLGNGVISNVGATFDFSADFNNANVPGIVFYRIRGIPVTNVQNYKSNSKIADEFDYIDRSHFLDYLATKNITVPQKNSILEVVTSNVVAPYKIEDNIGSLIIDETASQKINTENLDENTSTNFTEIPNELIFIIQNTMFFNNFSENKSLSVFLRVSTIIKEGFGSEWAKFWEDFIEEPVNTTKDFLFDNILLISIILVIISIMMFWRKRSA